MGHEDDDKRRSAESDNITRLGAKHGADEANAEEVDRRGTGLTMVGRMHPSRRLELRAKGFGIGGGYERPYRKEKRKQADSPEHLYGPIPHAGYYGAGSAQRPFKVGQATFGEEVEWYRHQYGETTSGYEPNRKK